MNEYTCESCNEDYESEIELWLEQNEDVLMYCDHCQQVEDVVKNHKQEHGNLSHE